MKQSFNPKVSIVIPVYNGSNYLREAIDSALAQTYKNVEVIVINDGSNDGGKTDKICKSYGNKIRYFKKENGGVSSALNMGIEKMEGEYFSWLSHDDVYLPRKIETQIKFLASNQLQGEKVILFANYELIDKDSILMQRVELDHTMLDEKPEYALLRGCINGITLLIPVTAFKECGLFNTSLKYTQDYDLWRRMSNSYKFVHMENILTQTRIHALQDSNKQPNVVKEGDALWISMMEGLSKETKERLESTEYNFYNEMELFLSGTPYEGALEFVKVKKENIWNVTKKSFDEVKVTVIIPFYNRISMLLASIESVLSQTHKNLEVILINDGSTEDISELNKYLKKDSRLKMVSFAKNQGASSARNEGIKQATGKYIAFLDSDDLFFVDKIEQQLMLMKLYGYKVSHTSYIRRNIKSEELIKSGEFTGMVFPQIISSCPIATPTAMMETDFLKKSGVKFIKDFKIGEDTCFWLDLLRETKLLGIKKAYTIVNVNSNSAAIDHQKQIIGLTNILRHIFSDKQLSKFHREISNLCSAYISTSAQITVDESKHLVSPTVTYYTPWNREKPWTIFPRAIFLFKYQGVLITIKKVCKKYFKKFINIVKTN